MNANQDSKNSKRQILSPRDLVFILALLLCALLFGMIWRARPPFGDRVCSVILDGKPVATVPLDKDQVFSLPQLPQVTFEVRGGRAAFIRSDCPDQICVHTGFIGNHGQFAACLPNRAVLRVGGGESKDAPDTVTW